MLNSSNPKTRHRSRASHWLGLVRAIPRACHPEPCRLILANGGEGSAFRRRPWPLDSCQLAPKLDFPLTPSQHTTSQFLIDNFCTLLRSPASKGTSVGSPRALHPPLATRHSSLPSNRHNLELEMPVSHRKQRIGPISNRHKIAFCNIHVGAALIGPTTCSSVAVRSQLLTLDCKLSPLIANETHSRKQSSTCKQGTYKILIANEFHSRISSEIVPRDRQHERHIKIRYNGGVKIECNSKGDKK